MVVSLFLCFCSTLLFYKKNKTNKPFGLTNYSTTWADINEKETIYQKRRLTKKKKRDK